MRTPRILTGLVFAVALPLLLLTPPAAASFCSNPVSPTHGPGAGSSPPECPPEGCPNDCKKCTNSPIYAGKGVYGKSFVDLLVPTVGSPIEVRRTYLSSRPVDGPNGVGWIPSLGARLQVGVYVKGWRLRYQRLASVFLPGGNRLVFEEQLDRSWLQRESGHDSLTSNPDGTWDFSPAGSREVFHFSASGALLWSRDENGNQTEYIYDGNGRLERIADASGSGRYLDVYWGPDGRISTVVDSAGREVSYSYDPDGTLATVEDPVGRLTRYEYTPGRFSPLLTRIKDHWNRVLTEITYTSGDKTQTYTENGETFTYTYQSATTTLKRDSAGNTLTFTMDAKGWFITDRAAPAGSGGGTKHTDFNADGSVRQVQDEAGVWTAYTYDTDGKVLTVTRDSGGSLAVRNDYTYDPAFPEKVASVTPMNPASGLRNPDWQGWRYDYYPEGSPSPGSLFNTYRVRYDGTTDTVATYEYDSNGRVTSQSSFSGPVTDYTYDQEGNLWTVTAPANNDSGTRPVTTYGYDALGRVTSVTDPQGQVTSYTYDALGRVLTVTLPKPTAGSPLNFVTTYTYDQYDASTGLVFTHVTDPNQKVTRLGYDQFGRLVRTVDAATNATVYGYTNDLLTSITDANGNVTGYDYDALKRLETTTFPDNATETYTYYPDGLLHTKADRNGVTVTYTYDHHKRLVTKSYSSGGSVGFTYQGQKLTQVDDTTTTPAETQMLGYDDAYRVSSVTQGPRGTLTYTYGLDDRVETATIGGGPTTTYGYHPDGSVWTLNWTPVGGSFSYFYLLNGQHERVSFPNGQTRNYSYDDQGRLTQITNALGATTLSATGYGYDVDPQTGQATLLGQRTTQTVTLPHQGLSAVQVGYGYDALYQLTLAQYPAPAPFNGELHGWAYDGIGNRTTQTVNGTPQTYTYFKNASNPLNGQRLQSDGTRTYGYDDAGNATSVSGSQTLTLGYDADNRLESLAGDVAASYTYDYQGRRTSKTVAGTTTTYLYDGLNVVAETTSGQTRYFLNGAGIDEPLATSRMGRPAYFSVDGLGSVVATNNSAGTVSHSVVFDAWGNVRAESGTRTHPFTYTGRELGEAGLHFYRARYYQPGIGRFTQEDPLRAIDPSFPSEYRYVRNSPISLADPLGLYTLKLRRHGPIYNKFQVERECIVEGATGIRNCTTWANWRITCKCKCDPGGFFSAEAVGEVDATILMTAKNAKSQAHEEGHIKQIGGWFEDYLRGIEGMDFSDETECNRFCGRQHGIFHGLYPKWARDSQKDLG